MTSWLAHGTSSSWAAATPHWSAPSPPRGRRRVLVLERAPEALRGGNTRHTRNVRCVHGKRQTSTPARMAYDEMWGDLCGVGEGPSDEGLAELTLRALRRCPAGSTRARRAASPPVRHAALARTNRFFLGGGRRC